MKKPKDHSQALVFVTALCLHILLLLGAYYLPIRQWSVSSSGYDIALYTTTKTHLFDVSNGIGNNPAPPQPVKEQSDIESKKVIEDTTAQNSKEAIPKDALTTLKNTSDQGKFSQENLIQDPREVNTYAKPERVDKRSLYKTQEDKQTGTFLELTGWIWDMIPQPQDSTNESGKIVFQIKIDALGEVIAVKTLEKTISPLLEGIYKESLIGLTFSKTADNLVDNPISTGKVTFILQVK